MTRERSNKAAWVQGVLAAILLCYLVFAFMITDHLYANQRVQGIEVKFNSKTPQNFISKQNILDEIDVLHIDSQLVAAVSLSEIETKLKNFINIEDAMVTRTPQGIIQIAVTPVIPVARVFNASGDSYYINRQGKKITADARYHIDVPVITGHIDDSVLNATELLPLLEYIDNDPLWNSLTTALKVEKDKDVILIPNIKGHVVNLGNATDGNYEDKFQRLKIMYREIIPHKGWQYYDTISLKFAGQVVASRAKKRKIESDLKYELIDSEEVSLDNMNTNAETNNPTN